MIASRASMFRPSLQPAGRRHVLSHLTRPISRRGYASLQERVGQSSDTPWQIAAVAVTVPGLLYLRNSGGTAQARHGEVDLRRAEPAHKASAVPKASEAVREAPQAVSSVKSAAVEKMEEGIQKTQNAAGMESGSSSESEGAATPSSAASTQGTSTQMDQSAESQAQKLTDKQASQRVDPTQK